MKQDQKEAMARGRAQSHVVDRYLTLLRRANPSGHRRTIEELDQRLGEIEVELQGAPALKAVHLEQERIDILAEKRLRSADSELADAEAAFIKVGRSYAEAKGLSYAAFRAVGVPGVVLKKANVSR